MQCSACGQRSDWLGDRSGWAPVRPNEEVTVPLLECDRCGNRQRLG